MEVESKHPVSSTEGNQQVSHPSEIGGEEGKTVRPEDEGSRAKGGKSVWKDLIGDLTAVRDGRRKAAFPHRWS